MKFKLKILTLALALSLMLAACGKEANKTDKKDDTKTSQAPKEVKKESTKKEEVKKDPNQSKAAADFDEKVNSIKEASLSEEFTINSLNEEYKKLSDADKKQVKTKDKLDKLTNEIKTLTAEFEKVELEKTAKEFDKKVEEKFADPKLTDLSIAFLNDEFETLDPKVQELVASKDKLKSELKEANARRVKEVEELIEKIGSKGKKSKEYEEARTAYELLDKKVLKEQVKNADKLK